MESRSLVCGGGKKKVPESLTDCSLASRKNMVMGEREEGGWYSSVVPGGFDVTKGKGNGTRV